MEDEGRWLCPLGLEARFKFKRKTQDKWRMQKKIPYSKIGRFILYDKYEIDSWIEAHKVAELKK